jgi:hypothetical protein
MTKPNILFQQIAMQIIKCTRLQECIATGIIIIKRILSSSLITSQLSLCTKGEVGSSKASPCSLSIEILN